MTDTTLPPGDDSVDRIEPVDIQQEMQRSYIDYAMSVIVGRALPEVRDGLKPVHRRVLYAMFDSGFRPDRSHAKSARSVAETMGNYHPHGDASIYDTLVRMAQPWSLRYPLVDGQGNFGSPGNDPPAAMRYCITGDAMVRLPLGQSVRIRDVIAGASPNSDLSIDVKVSDRHGNPVTATRLFHSGEHQTYTVRTAEGYQVTGTANHPLLCLVDIAGVPTLLWKLIEEIRPTTTWRCSARLRRNLGRGSGARRSRPCSWAHSSARVSCRMRGRDSTIRMPTTSQWWSRRTTLSWAVRGMSISGRLLRGRSCLSWTCRTSTGCATVAWARCSASARLIRPFPNGCGNPRPRSSGYFFRRFLKATARVLPCLATQFRCPTQRAASSWLLTCSRCCWNSV